jgi:hypothetical protein
MTNKLMINSNNDGLLSLQTQNRFEFRAGTSTELRTGPVRSSRGKAKSDARIFGNEAYFYICRLGSGVRQKQSWSFLSAFGASPR